jgi:hypothetical protein
MNHVSETESTTTALPLDAGPLRARLAEVASAEGLEWLAEAEAKVAADPKAVAGIFPAVGRKVGRGPLHEGENVEDVHAWRVDDAARTLILVALGDNALAELPDLYRFGDAAERRGLLRALAYLPIGDEALTIADDAVRSNDTFLIAAALGPYATRWFTDSQYDHAVLKCVFVGVPITPLHGLPARVTPNGARMLASLVLERVAAGRAVPAEVWRVIDRYPPAEEIAAIEREAESPFEDRRTAAQKTLADREKESTNP